MTKKMSEIMLEMAATLLKDSVNPSSEAAHAALLFAHVAWNRANGNKVISYKKVLNEFEYSNPDLWDELKLTAHGKIIKSLVVYKNEYYPGDSRVIYICGMRKNNVHVEWACAK
ncbi:MAG: hypothetical protein V1927_06515 [Candidatus Omnitrophota bacterium]